jgi:hypothetical protein
VAADIEAAGSGAAGSTAAGSAAAAALELESAALSLLAPVDGFAASSARSKNTGIRNMANAAVAIILALNLIVASRTARRDHRKSQRRVNSTRIGHAKQRIA